MLKFLIGYILGGIIGFIVCAVLSVNHTGKESVPSIPVSEEAEDNSAETRLDTEV